jgi:hypothetical protein
MGLPQPEQRRPEDLFWQQMGNQFTTAALGGAAAHRLIGASAFTQGMFKSLSPAVQQALRWTSGIGTESFVSTALTDNRQGNPANLLGENAPMAVQPTDDMVSALGKSLLPNAGVEIGFGLAGLGVGKGLNNVTRRIREGRAAQEVANARNWTKENGIQVEADGAHDFTPEAKTAPPPEPEAPAAAPAPKAEPAPAPAAKPAAQPPTAKQAEDMLLGPEEEAPVYDPSLPEVDVAVQALDRLDDQRLQEAAAVAGPVLPELDRHLGEQKANFQLQEGLNAEQLGGPTENLANPAVAYDAQWQQLPTDTLLSVAAPQNSPRLFEKVQGLTGREFEEFTRGDVIDGLKALREEGLTVLPNRLQGGSVMDVNSIAVDPARFQFKDNVNAQGQQKGNSLEGVTKWNPDSEGVIQTWTDAADGKTYVVNGHNRLAKAKELGINSIRTEEILANTPEQARAVGAIANIASGGGTAFDAAKVIRELGIADPAGLEAAGIPLQSGLGTQGLALSKLPGNLFQAAVNGELPLGRALALGGSGMDPESMIRVVQLSQGRDMTERGFAELTQMASTAPKVESDQMGLFGPEVIDTTVIKAELAAKVRADLTSNKNLFKKVGRNKNATKLAEKGGTEVNQGQVQDAASVAESVLAEFDQTKYMAETPISQLLNDGAAQIAGGAKRDVIVKRILAHLEQAAEASPPAPKAPVEEPALDAGGLSAREVKKYSQMTPEGIEQVKAEADKYLLGDRALANREAKWQAMQENEALVEQFNRESPGSNDPAQLSEEDFLAKWGTDESKYPVLSTNSDYNQTKTALDRHKWAKAFLAWYEENVGAAPLLPDQRNALKKKVVTQLIQNGEVRPSEAPLPELPAPPKDLSNPELALADELRLAGEYAEQDAIRKQVELDIQRKAIGYDDMPLEEKKANGMLDSWEKPEVVADPTAAPAQPFEIEIPEAAGRKITAKTSESRIRSAAESLASWTRVPGQEPMSPEKALALVRAKGAIFDPDKLPGVDVDAARNDVAMGRSTPGTEAVTQAYKQFYGLNQGLSELQSIAQEKKANGMLDGWEMLRPGSPLFHGTTEAGRKGIMADGFRVSNAERAGTVLGEGVYFASNERYASAYGGKTAWGELPPEAKILDLSAQDKTVGDLAKEAGVTGELETYRGDVRLTYEQQQQVKDWALANGYDGIRYRSFDTPDKPELETVIYNVDLANRLVGSKAGNGLTTQTAGTLDERAQLARQQLEQAKAQGDEAGAAAWQQELRQLERSRVANAMDANATTQQEMLGVGQYDTSTPLLSQPPSVALESIQPPTRIPLDDGSPGPFEVEAELRERRQARAMEIIQRVTGLDDGLTVRFEDLYLKRIRPKEWGGDGKTMTRSGGTYNIQEDTMTLRAALQATDREWDEAAFHESWHRVQYLALSPKEAAVMDTNWARLKTSLAANHGAGGGIAYAETQAVAFQRYGAARLNGQDPIKAMLGGYQPGTTKLEKAANAIASAFDKVLDFVEKVHNAFSIGTFDSTRGIFERAYQGALKGDANFNFELPGSGMNRMLDGFPNRGWRRSTWDYARSGGVKPADLELAVVNIDTQIADLKSKALAGGC